MTGRETTPLVAWIETEAWTRRLDHLAPPLPKLGTRSFGALLVEGGREDRRVWRGVNHGVNTREQLPTPAAPIAPLLLRGVKAALLVRQGRGADTRPASR
jgi:hypothetical protein